MLWPATWTTLESKQAAPTQPVECQPEETATDQKYPTNWSSQIMRCAPPSNTWQVERTAELNKAPSQMGMP